MHVWDLFQVATTPRPLYIDDRLHRPAKEAIRDEVDCEEKPSKCITLCGRTSTPPLAYIYVKEGRGLLRPNRESAGQRSTGVSELAVEHPPPPAPAINHGARHVGRSSPICRSDPALDGCERLWPVTSGHAGPCLRPRVCLSTPYLPRTPCPCFDRTPSWTATLNTAPLSFPIARSICVCVYAACTYV